MPLVVYSLLRFALFVVALLALAATSMGGWLLVVVAAFVAWALSYVLLAGRRDAAALWIAERAAQRRASGVRFSAGVESDAVAEDAEAGGAGGADGPDGADGRGSQSASPRPSSTP